MIYNLKSKKNQLLEKESKLEIMDISWNSSGLLISTCLGKLNHDSFC